MCFVVRRLKMPGYACKRAPECLACRCKRGPYIQPETLCQRDPRTGTKRMHSFALVQVNVVKISVIAIHTDPIIDCIAQCNSGRNVPELVRVCVFKQHFVIDHTEAWNDIDVIAHQSNGIGEFTTNILDVNVVTPNVAAVDLKQKIVHIDGTMPQNTMTVPAPKVVNVWVPDPEFGIIVDNS